MSTDGARAADELEVANRRLDASENEALIGMARMGAEAFGYTSNLRIDRGLAQLLRLRVAQLNNCTYCLLRHHGAAREAGIPRSEPCGERPRARSDQGADPRIPGRDVLTSERGSPCQQPRSTR